MDQGANLYIDIECDEPYVYDTGEATHYMKSDQKRDRAFIENGWFVLRFAEQQIIETPESCCQILAKLIARYTRNQSILSQFQDTPQISKIRFWTKAQAQQMAQERVRDRYLNQISNSAIDSLSHSTVLSTLAGFINTETDSKIRETKQIWRKPLSERVEDGTAIASYKEKKFPIFLPTTISKRFT